MLVGIVFYKSTIWLAVTHFWQIICDTTSVVNYLQIMRREVRYVKLVIRRKYYEHNVDVDVGNDD